MHHLITMVLSFIVLATHTNATAQTQTNSDQLVKTASIQSEIKADENLIFFRTVAWLDTASDEWHIPIHAWVYEFQDSKVRKKIVAKSLEKKYQLKPTEDNEANFSQRVNLMLADNERGKTVAIKLADKQYVLRKSEANGHINDLLIVPDQEIRRLLAVVGGEANSLHTPSGDWLEFTASVTLENSVDRVFKGRSLLLPSEGMSIISDIDDTVKISDVRDHKKLFNNTFYNDFVAVPMMAKTYQKWRDEGLSLHFVSSSPWQLYSPLVEFMHKQGFPEATVNLKAIRLKDSSVLNLFKLGTETKPLQIEPILNNHPKRKFILVGDSGEQDPEVYAALFERYPNQIQQIYIRNVTAETANDERFTKVFENVPKEQWALFTDPSVLSLP